MQLSAHLGAAVEVSEVEGGDHVILAMGDRDRPLEIFRDLRLIVPLDLPEPASKVLPVREHDAEDRDPEEDEEGVAG